MKIACLLGVATLLIAASAAAQNGDKAISNPASKTSISFATATPGGGFPLYGNAFAEVMNAADPTLLDRAAQHQGQQREHSAAGGRQGRYRDRGGRAFLRGF